MYFLGGEVIRFRALIFLGGNSDLRNDKTLQFCPETERVKQIRPKSMLFLNRKLHTKKVDKSLLCDFKHLLE